MIVAIVGRFLTDYLLVTFVLLSPEMAAGRMSAASGQRESATNRLGEQRWYGPRPDAAEMQKFSTTKPPDAGGVSFLVT